VLEGIDLLQNYERVVDVLHRENSLKDSLSVTWRAAGRVEQPAGGKPQVWLSLHLQTQAPLQCQRCLEPYAEPVDLTLDFRFVATEQQAEQEDEDSEEDLLVLSKHFNLRELVEDELLMALPIVPRHARCPQAVKLSAQDDGFDAGASGLKKKPFAELKDLLKRP
jgi:uncharacterized protein